MPDKERDDLENELRELRTRIEYPPTPDLARTVRRRLDAEASESPGVGVLSRLLSRPGWAAAAALTILLSLFALSPAMRSTVSGYSFGGGGAGGGAGAGAASGAAEDASSAEDSPASSPEYAVEESASPGGQGASGGAAAGSSAAGYGMPLGEALGLGERLSTPGARDRVGDLLVPGEVLPGLEAGSEDYVCAEAGVMCAAGGPSDEDGVVLVFRPGWSLAPLGKTDVGLVLIQTPGGLDVTYDLSGGWASGARREEVVVGGERGFWFPDGRLLRPQPGEIESLPGGALLWERGGVALLMRAEVSREEAIRIAETVR